MSDPRALALGLVHPASFVPPPRRPRRMSAADDGLGRNLMRAFRREPARATEEPPIGLVPQLQRYPY